ncbi:hypothetical protein BIW11_09721 [Tropilaelaps mercedesae]|uniref:Uncharacterized protein n=1 Tax=Tropilaelaps mercedesae TaxID=418985 RepID=A0A1V9XIW5_9ACAR|nr:hypothetical protein BIW11_09721 [Tropilaelaps mercedesae]
MPSGRKTNLSKALISSSGSSESGSDNAGSSTGRATPPTTGEEDSSSSSSFGPHTPIYNNPRCHARQFWMTASCGSLVNLIGYAFRHGRVASLIHLTKMLYNEPTICGFEAPLRGLLFAAFHYRLNRRLLADLAACALPLEPIVRTSALLESLLLMLQNEQLTYEIEPITNWADGQEIKRESSHKVDPVLAIFHGYVALQRIRELTKLQADPEMLSDTITDDERSFREVALRKHMALARKSLKACLCVPGVAGDVFLQMGLQYEQIDDEFDFEKILKLYIKRNPAHLTGFLFYCQLLRARRDADSSIRRLTCIRKILTMSPADGLALEYAETILKLGEAADTQDVAERLATYLDHWERRTCLRGWRLLGATLLSARKYEKSVEIMNNREFWWVYHFPENVSVCDCVTLAKALVVSLLTDIGHSYVRAIRSAAIAKDDGRLEHALKVAADPQNFRLDMFVAPTC